MKKGKKLISFLLAGLLSVSAATVAFAAEGQNANEVEAAIDNFYCASSSTSLLDANNNVLQLAKDYKALSDAQKDGMKSSTQAKIIALGYNTAIKLNQAAGGGFSLKTEAIYLQYNKDAIGDLTAKQEKSRELAGYMTGYVAIDGILLKTSLQFTEAKDPNGLNSKALDNCIKMWTEASPVTRELSSFLTYDSSGKFIKPDNKAYQTTPGYAGLKNLISVMEQRYRVAQHPWNGLTAEEKAQYANDENLYKASIFQTFLTAKDMLTADELAGYNAARTVCQAYEQFWTNGYTTQGLKDALSEYGQLTASQSRFPVNFSNPVLATYKSVADALKPSRSMMAMSAVVTNSNNATTMDEVNKLVDMVNGMQAPYANADIRAMDTQYGRISSFLYGLIPADVDAKRVAIHNAYVPQPDPTIPSEDAPDVSGFTPGEYDFARYVNYPRAAEALEGLKGMLPTLLTMLGAENLEQLLASGVYTNKTVSTLIKTVYVDLVTPLIPADIQQMAFAVLGPNAVGVKIQRGGNDFPIATKFTSVPISMDGFDVIINGGLDKNGASIEGTQNGDWGFQDGDRDGFFQAIASGLRALLDVATNGMAMAGLAPILILPNTTDSYGDYKYGAYEALLPILEGIGLKNLPSSVEITAAYNAAIATETALNKNTFRFDTLLMPILDSLGDFIDAFTADPVNMLVDTLGKVGYMVSTGALNDNVASLLKCLNGFEIPAIDLTGDALNTMIAGLLEGLQFGADADGNGAVSIDFLPIDWDMLGSLGTLKTADSACADSLYRADFVSDRPAAFAMVLDYLASLISSNSDAILKIASSIPDVGAAVNLIAPMLSDADLLRGLVYDLLAPARPVTFTDEKTGITLTADTSLLPEDGVLVVEKLASNDAAVSEAMKDTADCFSGYSVSILREGKPVSPDGTVTVTMPADQQLNADRFAVYVLGGDGAAVPAEFTNAKGIVTVKTDRLGDFIMAQVKETVELPTESETPSDNGEGSGSANTNNPNTGDIMLASFAAIALGAGAVVLLMKKRNAE